MTTGLRHGELHEEHATPQGKRSLLGRVLNFRKTKGYEDLHEVQVEWECAVIKYNMTEGTQKLSEDLHHSLHAHPPGEGRGEPAELGKGIRHVERCEGVC